MIITTEEENEVALARIEALMQRPVGELSEEEVVELRDTAQAVEAFEEKFYYAPNRERYERTGKIL